MRSVILAGIALPLFMAYGARLTRRYERNFFAKLFFRGLILFGGFFGLSFAFNKSFVQNSIGFGSKDAMYMGLSLIHI